MTRKSVVVDYLTKQKQVIQIQVLKISKESKVWMAIHLYCTAQKKKNPQFFFSHPQLKQVFCSYAMLKIILMGSMKLLVLYH